MSSPLGIEGATSLAALSASKEKEEKRGVTPASGGGRRIICVGGCMVYGIEVFGIEKVVNTHVLYMA
jgi:hypothetical protein